MEKEQALSEWKIMTRLSGSYAQMTEEQRNALEYVFEASWFKKAIRGTYEQRVDIMNAILFAFYMGVGI